MLKVTARVTPILLGALGAICISGCNSARAPHSARSNAPRLGGDEFTGGANPNAPFMVVDHTARLVRRPALIDVNAAPPCTADGLSLFESGARIDGDRRSVRLNLVNHGSQPCRLSGFPAISLLHPDGSLIGRIAIEKVNATTLEAALHPGAASAAALGTHPPAAQSSPAQPSPYVLLSAAGEATFEVGWSSEQQGQPCDQVGSIAVRAPGTAQSFTVRHTLTICAGRILVTAINDGSQL